MLYLIVIVWFTQLLQLWVFQVAYTISDLKQHHTLGLIFPLYAHIYKLELLQFIALVSSYELMLVERL